MKEGLEVRRVAGARGFITALHYTHGVHNGPRIFGLFRDGFMVGAVAYANPISENVRASVFGPEHSSRVTELHRLVVEDGQPRNSATFLIARSLRQLKLESPHLWGVISFADSTEGHIGYVYQAANAIYCGSTGAGGSYHDPTGRLRAPRQNGVNIAPVEAAARGWVRSERLAKHRYLFLIAGRRDRPRALESLRLASRPYPKGGPHAGS